jgi:hypothetical protein
MELKYRSDRGENMTEKKLRYSDVVGSYFYNIVLGVDDKDMVDTHFTGAAHHLKRFHEATTKDHKYFHLRRHRIHLSLMMGIIYMRGNFDHAADESNRNLDRRETWNPDWTTMPDPNMFNKMYPDWRFVLGVAHCADHYIHSSDMTSFDKQVLKKCQ